MTSNQLRLKAIQIRKSILSMIYKAKTGHTGGALSSADIITALYYGVMRIDPKNPNLPERDRFILSKGHSVEGYYAILADMGFIDQAELDTFSDYQARLIGHPNNKVPGVEMNTGALGHGLSIAAGMALGLSMNKSDARVFVLMGDGELAEGSVWEGAMSAAHYKLSNLTAIIDRNRLQISGSTEKVMALEPLAAKWQAFGWRVEEIDGHDVQLIVDTLNRCHLLDDKPSLIIANTVKGKGVAEMENIAKWHHGVPNEELYKRAIADFDFLAKELEVNA
jgi:transketolase